MAPKTVGANRPFISVSDGLSILALGRTYYNPLSYEYYIASWPGCVARANDEKPANCFQQGPFEKMP